MNWWEWNTPGYSWVQDENGGYQQWGDVYNNLLSRIPQTIGGYYDDNGYNPGYANPDYQAAVARLSALPELQGLSSNGGLPRKGIEGASTFTDANGKVYNGYYTNDPNTPGYALWSLDSNGQLFNTSSQKDRNTVSDALIGYTRDGNGNLVLLTNGVQPSLTRVAPKADEGMTGAFMSSGAPEFIAFATGVGGLASGALGELAGADAAQNAFQNLSDAAKNFTKSIGETLLPNADPMVQRLVGQVATNTATNGGDFEKAVTNSVLSLGTGALGAEVADVTGSDLAGKAASSAASQLATTGNVDLTKLSASTLGNAVGSEVSDATDSPLAGKAASTLVSRAVQGKDPTQALLNMGINVLTNEAVGSISNFLSSSGADDSVSGNTSQTPDSSTGNHDTAGDTHLAVDNTTGGLNAVSTATTATQGNTAQQTQDDLTQLAGNQNVTPINTTGDATQTTSAPATSTGGLNQVLSSTTDTLTNPVVTSAETGVPTNPTVSTTTPTTSTVPAGGLGQVSATTMPMAATGDTRGIAVADTTKPAPTTDIGADTNTAPTTTSSTGTTAPINQQWKTLGSALVGNLLGTNTAPAPRGGLSTASKMVSAQQLSAMKPSKPPARVDVSKLKPVIKAPVAPPAKVDVRTLTPITNVAGLSSILENIFKKG